MTGDTTLARPRAAARLSAHPDRLLPGEAMTREVARRLYQAVADAPILSPHGHLEASDLLANEVDPDPAAVLITPDHYVLRLLHSHGWTLDRLGVPPAGGGRTASSREAWAALCSSWPLLAGTPVRYWLESVLVEVFGVTERPSADSADRLYDQVSEVLASPASRPRAVLERFGVEVLATTDDPCDDLAAHRALAADAGFGVRVLPTLRPDAYLDPGRGHWPEHLHDLAQVTGEDCGTAGGLLAALEQRRAYFREHGATAVDVSLPTADTVRLTAAEAERLHRRLLAGEGDEGDVRSYRAHLLYEQIRMSSEDRLVLQLHPSVLRNHHGPTLRRYGPNTGHDLPDRGGYSRQLAAALQDLGTAPGLRMVLFTLDETLFSRELGPLAGFYPSVYVGAPWWFLDTPEAIARFRRAVTDSAGFHKTAGFVDDTRALYSVHTRHDMARRLDAGHLARLVVSHQLTEDEAVEIATALVDDIPRTAFRLPGLADRERLR